MEIIKISIKLRMSWITYLAANLLVGCSNSLPGQTNQIKTATMGQARLQLGLEYLARGDLSAARQHIEKVINKEPKNYWAQLAMALYEQRIGENSAAEQRYQHAMKLAPRNGVVLNNYGVFLCGLGQYVAAQRQFSVAASLPDYGQVADSLENAGYCFLKASKDQEAKAFLSRALKYDLTKGEQLLTEASRQFEEGKRAQAQLLLDVYQHELPVSASSLWLEIRFAALANRQDSVQRYGEQLARDFPQSKQYQHFLANEY